MSYLIVNNNGQEIESTNFWDSEMADEGLFYLTWNEGAARLLVPDVKWHVIPEMRTGKQVVISDGPWLAHEGRPAMEVMFDDGSESPYAITMITEQSDRRLPHYDHGRKFPFHVCTRFGKAHSSTGIYRAVNAIPCLAPWYLQ